MGEILIGIGSADFVVEIDDVGGSGGGEGVLLNKVVHTLGEVAELTVVVLVVADDVAAGGTLAVAGGIEREEVMGLAGRLDEAGPIVVEAADGEIEVDAEVVSLLTEIDEGADKVFGWAGVMVAGSNDEASLV